VQFGNKKIHFRGSFQSQFQKYHPSGNLKFNDLGVFQSLKLVNSMGKILGISLKLNFTRNTMGCYGLITSLELLAVLQDEFWRDGR